METGTRHSVTLSVFVLFFSAKKDIITVFRKLASSVDSHKGKAASNGTKNYIAL